MKFYIKNMSYLYVELNNDVYLRQIKNDGTIENRIV
jgi:hypothetical protein